PPDLHLFPTRRSSDLTGLAYIDRATDEAHEIALSGIFVQIGLLPNTDWLKNALDLTPRGEIRVDDHGATSIPGVFAAGDCTTTPDRKSTRLNSSHVKI